MRNWKLKLVASKLVCLSVFSKALTTSTSCSSEWSRNFCSYKTVSPTTQVDWGYKSINGEPRAHMSVISNFPVM